MCVKIPSNISWELSKCSWFNGILPNFDLHDCLIYASIRVNVSLTYNALIWCENDAFCMKTFCFVPKLWWFRSFYMKIASLPDIDVIRQDFDTVYPYVSMQMCFLRFYSISGVPQVLFTGWTHESGIWIGLFWRKYTFLSKEKNANTGYNESAN